MWLHQGQCVTSPPRRDTYCSLVRDILQPTMSAFQGLAIRFAVAWYMGAFCLMWQTALLTFVCFVGPVDLLFDYTIIGPLFNFLYIVRNI